MKAKTVDMQRRGNVSMMVLTSLGAVLATGAVVIDLGFAWVVRQQLQNTVDAAAMAAAMEIDGTEDGLEAARAAARHIGGVNLVNGHGLALTDHQIIFGEYDVEAKLFEPSDDPLLIDAVRVVGLERKVGLGMARIAWGRDGVDVYATAGVLAGAGTANDGTHDDWGLVGGHFDVDVNTKQPLPNKGSTDGHVHEYYNKYDVTSYDVLAPRDPGKLAPMQNKVAANQRFKLIVANADLSRGGLLFINDQVWNVTEYDDIPLSELPVYSLGGVAGSEQLWHLEIYFDRDAIGSCKLHPTNTGDVRGNVLGPDGQWRNGAFDLMAVAVDSAGNDAFTTAPGHSEGGVQGVAMSGLLFEVTMFWHWKGDSFHKANWEAQYDSLPCVGPRIFE